MRELLYPRSIAVLGASNDPVKLSGRPVDYMKRFGYRGRLLPINPTRRTVQGLPAYRSLDEVDGDIDLVMIMLPAERVSEAVRTCGKRGVKAAIVGAAGFAETDAAGAAMQEELRTAAAESGVRVLGPNCLGMMSVADRALPTFSSSLDEHVELRSGPVAFVSQSGAFGSWMFSEAQRTGIGISHYINTGNEVDLTVPELLDALLDSEQTRVLLAYLEGVNDGERLLTAARRASLLDKPIIAVKVGRSVAGARAAQSHTASLAGEDAVFDGIARQHGIVRVDGTEAMLDAAQIFAAGRRSAGRRLTALTGSGGAGILMADAATAAGLIVESWDEPWQAKMAAVIPAYGTARNPVDLTGMLVVEPDLLRRSLEVALDHPGTDMIVVLLGNSDGCADEFVAAVADAHETTDRPIVVVWTGGSGIPRRRLRDLGIPCYTDPGRAAAALGLLADYSLRPAMRQPERPPRIDPGAAREVIRQARAAGRSQLDEEESSRLIAAYGVRCAESRAVADADAAVAAFAELGGPVAVKLLSDRIGHKSDIGGVRLGLSDTEEIRAAAGDLLALARCEGVPEARLLVQRMAEPGTELIIGIKRDPAFGPVVVAGLGGVLVEVLADSASAAAPVGPETARHLLTGLRGGGLLGAVRGRPPRDVDAAADAVARVSWLAADLADEIAELDVNPLMVAEAGAGAVAVDCLAVLTKKN
ncbi:acetate--CoA ligase family protein [Actinomadura rugatobispora]|uniref:Acetate--CoA ligase family protein n=1 Tax=Actinomadura rugatobispora TaxID=1994 RepID=A0ABW1A836_9ACTN|nr:acetate--CoA ligase family protein [Actinomadura rugatobispora]